MKSIAEALEAMTEGFTPIGVVGIPLEDASGFYLAEEVTARFDSPSFDNSAMDGYAVRAQDVTAASPESPVTLTVSGESRAGETSPPPLSPHTACRILTGAPMPEGADSVVIQEDTKRVGTQVLVMVACPLRSHVRERGSDLSAGAAIMQTGDVIGPGEIGLLASQNVSEVRVFERPTIALVSTGDELREIGDSVAHGQIINSNAYVLADMVRRAGAIPLCFPAVPDDLSAIEDVLQKALEADVVITTGGVSVGSYDLVQRAFDNLGVQRGFWKVRIKPGKPIAFALHGETPVIGLPGNPISAMVTFEILVLPCIRRMLGDRSPHPQPVPATLRGHYRKRPGRVEIARGVAERQGAELQVTLHPRQGSGSLPSFVGVNALALLPADRGEFVEGEVLDVLLWGPGLRGARTFFDGLR